MTDTDIATARARWQKRIRHMREHSAPDGGPLSRWEFANLVGGFSPSSVEAWETRGTIPGGETIIRLAAHLPDGWTLEYLLGITADTDDGDLAGLEHDVEAAATSHARSATRGRSAQSHAKDGPP